MVWGTEVVESHPVAGPLALLVVATGVYAALSTVLLGVVEPVETLGFAVVFTVAYTTFIRYAEG